MLMGIDTRPYRLIKKQEYAQLQIDIKLVRTFNLFVYKNPFFICFSLLSIPILVMGSNGGCFPAVCRLYLYCSGFEIGGCLPVGIF